MDRLPRPTRIALDILGLLITLCGIALTFVNEAYVVGGLLLVAVILCSILLVRHVRAHDFRFHTLHHYVEIKDASGNEAIWHKETVATPLERNIRVWKDHLFHGSGSLHFETTNMGKLVEPEQQGGLPSVTTVFDSPLKVGTKIHKVLVIRCERCFTDNKESMSWIPMHKFTELGFHIRLPAARPCKGSPKALCYTGTTSEEVGGVQVEESGTKLDLVIRNPKMAAKYALMWEW